MKKRRGTRGVSFKNFDLLGILGIKLCKMRTCFRKRSHDSGNSQRKTRGQIGRSRMSVTFSFFPLSSCAE